MGCLQVAVADYDPAIHRSLQQAMQQDAELHFVGGARDGMEAYRLIREKQPDIAIVDMVMPKIDGITLIEQIKKDRTIRKEPSFILTTPAHNEQIMTAAFEMGVCYFMLKPYDPLVLTNRVKQLTGMRERRDSEKIICEDGKNRRCSESELEVRIKDMLHQLGIPAHLRGYRYMITAIEAVIEDEQMLECVTKALYPYVAREHDSTASRVERALRHAIEVAWGRGCIEAQDRMFGNTVSLQKGRPTNSEFIAMVASQIQQR